MLLKARGPVIINHRVVTAADDCAMHHGALSLWPLMVSAIALFPLRRLLFTPTSIFAIYVSFILYAVITRCTLNATTHDIRNYVTNDRRSCVMWYNCANIT